MLPRYLRFFAFALAAALCCYAADDMIRRTTVAAMAVLSVSHVIRHVHATTRCFTPRRTRHHVIRSVDAAMAIFSSLFRRH